MLKGVSKVDTSQEAKRMQRAGVLQEEDGQMKSIRKKDNIGQVGGTHATELAKAREKERGTECCLSRGQRLGQKTS